MAITGKYLSCAIGTTNIAGVQGWTATEDVAKLDGQTGNHAGFSANEPGGITLSITMDLIQDITSGVYSTISAGTTISNLKLYRNANGTSIAFDVPSFVVFNSEQKGAVRDRFTVRVSGEAYGSYTKSNPS